MAWRVCRLHGGADERARLPRRVRPYPLRLHARRQLHRPEQRFDNAIPDVKTGDAYAAEIYAFYRAGILTGSDQSGTFRPASSIQRCEVAAILFRMFTEAERVSITLN